MTSYHQQILAQMWGDQNTVADTSDASSVVKPAQPLLQDPPVVSEYSYNGPTAEEWAADLGADWWWGDSDPRNAAPFGGDDWNGWDSSGDAGGFTLLLTAMP